MYIIVFFYNYDLNLFLQSLEIARPKAKVVAGANRLSHYVYPAEVCLHKDKIIIISIILSGSHG
jgi:hypothetical protein